MSLEGLQVDNAITSSAFLDQTINLVRAIEVNFLQLAQRLHKIRELSVWSERYDSYNDFLENAKLSPSTASKLVSVYEQYVLKGGMDENKLVGAPYSSLYEAIPLLKDEDVETVVAKVKLLTRQELKDEVREEKDGECTEHELITICAKCKKRIYENKAEQG